MADITVNIAGLGGLMQDFERLSKGQTRKVLRQAAMAGARVGAKAIKAAAPVDEGITRKAVSAASKKKNDPGQHTAGVRVRSMPRDDGTNPSYTWRFSELGTSKEPARPWIRPTWDAMTDEIGEAVQDELGEAIDKVLSAR